MPGKNLEYNPAEDPYLQERIKEIEWYQEHGYSKITILQELCFEGAMKSKDAQALYAAGRLTANIIARAAIFSPHNLRLWKVNGSPLT